MRSVARVSLLGLALLAGMGTAAAQTVTFGTPSPASTTAGTAANGVTVAVSYTAGSNVGSYQLDVSIPSNFTSVSSNDARCVVGQPATSNIRISDINLGGTAIASGTVCTLTFSVPGSATAGNYNFSLCTTAPCSAPQARADILGANTPQTLQTSFGSGFTVNAPTADVGPTVTAGTPASGSTTAVGSGQTQGANFTSNIQFSAAGGSGSGTTTLSCSVTSSAGATATSATIVSGSPQTLSVGGAQPQPVVVRFTSPSAAQTVGVTCTAGASTFNYTYNVAAGTPVLAAPRPEVIPASSLWSQLALIGLMAGLGGLVVAMRRSA